MIIGGIGRLSIKGEKTAARAIRCADGCLARTPHDVAVFRQLANGQAPVRLLPDSALWTRVATQLPRDLPTGRLLLLALHGGTPPALQDCLIAVCTTLAQRHGLTVCTVAMHRGQDAAAAQRAAGATDGCVLPPLPNEVLIALMRARGALVISTRLHMLLFAAVAGVRAIAPQREGKIGHFAAFAATCDSAAAPPMLACPAARKTDILAAAEQALAQPPDSAQQQHYIEHLRRAGNGFSFSACLAAWQQKSRQSK